MLLIYPLHLVVAIRRHPRLHVMGPGTPIGGPGGACCPESLLGGPALHAATIQAIRRSVHYIEQLPLPHSVA